MTETTLPPALRELETVEEFLEFFELPYDPDLVIWARLHILQRFHDYMEKADLPSDNEAEVMATAKTMLAKAYDDFVHSHPLEERVFKVLQDAKKVPASGGRAFVPLSSIGGVKTPQNG
ncbi:MAG: nitrogenase-stabilizing/protective protein NifW [Defluviicoccus sp.]|nr:MAG: nitrogenase-stabilizing/protective protein NifW [Defluviicoccus sp.]